MQWTDVLSYIFYNYNYTYTVMSMYLGCSEAEVYLPLSLSDVYTIIYTLFILYSLMIIYTHRLSPCSGSNR